MAATIKAWADAILAGPRAAEARGLAARLASGTTSNPDDVRIAWLGVNLALVAWDYGGKEVVIISAGRRSESDAERAAARRLGVPRYDLPNRLTGSALSEAITKLSRADEVWTAIVAEERAKLAAAREEKDAEHAAARKEAALRDRLLVGLVRARAAEVQGTEFDGVARRWIAEIDARRAP